jgi:hypothetical protein
VLSWLSSRFTTIYRSLLLCVSREWVTGDVMGIHPLHNNRELSTVVSIREWVTSVVIGIQPLHNNLELFIVVSMQRVGY